MTSDSTPVFALEKEALKTEIETGLQVGVDHLEDKPMKRKPVEKYHNTRHMTKGHFTSSGHFIVLRGCTSDGKILVADPSSYKRSEKSWDMSIILNEASKRAGSGGPFWIIGN